MPNVMAALPNIGGALCSTPQSLANAHYLTVPCSNAAKMQNPLKFAGMPQTRQQISAVSIDIQSRTAEIRRGKKETRKKDRNIETTGQTYNGLPYNIWRP